MTMPERKTEQAEILAGTPVADEIKREVREEVARLASEWGVRPCLAVVRVGDDPASAVYVNSKVRTSEELGLHSEHHALPSETTEEELLKLVADLNAREEVDGILVQLPLPRAINETRVLEAIHPAKDVDGFHPMNVGRLSLGQEVIAP